MRYTLAVVLGGGALMLWAGVTPSSAQEDPRVTKMMQTFREWADSEETFHVLFGVTQEVNGQQQDEIPQEAWWKGEHHIRVDLPLGNLIVAISPDGAAISHGMSGVVLRIPAETLETLGDTPLERYRLAGVSPAPAELIKALAEEDTFSITDEEVVDALDCWQAEIAPESMERWQTLTTGDAEEAELTGLAFYVDKEELLLRRLTFEMTVTLPSTITIDVKADLDLRDFEIGVDVPDDFFTLEIPEDATVVTWELDQSPEDISKLFNETIIEAMKALEEEEAPDEE